MRFFEVGNQIRCGRIFFSEDFNFIFVCDLCDEIYGTSEKFVLHIKEHFPFSSCTKNEDGTSSDSENNAVLQEQHDIKEEICDLNVGASSQSTEIENLLTEEPDPTNQEIVLNEKLGEPANWSVYKKMKQPILNAGRFKRLQNKCLRRGTVVTLNEDIQANAGGSSPPQPPNHIQSQLSSAPEKSNESDVSKTRNIRFESIDCPKAFISRGRLKDRENIPGKRPYQCRSCPKSFKRREYLKIHAMRLHINVRYNCSSCEKTFADQSSLNIHIGQNHNKNLRQGTVVTLNEDVQANADGRNFLQPLIHVESQLSSATKKPTAGSNVSRRRQGGHENIHTGNLFQCQSCPKSFIRLQYLRKHIKRLHTNLRHICSSCNRSFLDKSSLDMHTIQNHLADTVTSRYFPCRLCDDKFVTKFKLYWHKVSMHRQPDAVKFICDYCQGVFAHRKYIVRHMDVHNDVKRFKCSHCNEHFSRKAYKHAHERRCEFKKC